MPENTAGPDASAVSNVCDPRLFYIVNVSHTRRDQRYISVWRPDCKGYAWPLSWAGRYAEEEVRAHMDYYNSGSNLVVPCEVLDALTIDPEPGLIDNDAGPVVPSNAANWKKVFAALIAKPTYDMAPLYRGAHRRAYERS